MRLDRFDLNLLIAFDVLVQERNVTRAAKRLNLTQSAMSAALRRLREGFGDEILVQHGKRMFPTTAALSLAPEVAQVLSDLRGIIARGLVFDPLQSSRIFHVVASDYISTVLFAPLIQRMQTIAPHIRFEISLPTGDILERLNDGEIDLLVSPERFLEGAHPRELLFEERHVVVGCADNPVLHGPLTEQAYNEAGHIAVSVTRVGTFIENHLRDQGDRRRIEITCPSFSQVAWMLPGTTRLALMHERLALMMAERLPLRIVEPPVKLPIMREMAQYHHAKSADAGILWLLQQLKGLADLSVVSRKADQQHR